jgi:hypothetical protein
MQQNHRAIVSRYTDVLRVAKAPSRRRSGPKAKSRPSIRRTHRPTTSIPILIAAGLVIAVGFLWWFNSQYTVSIQSPLVVRLRWPLVIAERTISQGAERAQADQRGRRLSAWQQYACRKFADDCRVALAIQRAENPQGKCEIYHYNSDGTLDWGYFQINTVHLKRPGLNLRDLLDCKANIDFAYQLYRERGGFTPWSTYNSGMYRKFIGSE